MGCYLKHLKKILKHKHYVFKECAACGIWWQGIIHDLSKFGWTEFWSTGKYFQGNRSPIEAEKEAIGHSKAWLHHKGHNKHHWEYWTDFTDDGEIIANKMPVKYAIEEVCDWIGAGKAYNGNKWTQDGPLIHYNKMRKGRYFHPETEEILVTSVHMIADRGLDEFHRYARELLRNSK